MSVSISTVRFTTHYVCFDDVALALDAIESVERFSEEVDNNLIWHFKIRMESGRQYDFTFNNPMENAFERMIA
jgi:hypothetical protein